LYFFFILIFEHIFKILFSLNIDRSVLYMIFNLKSKKLKLCYTFIITFKLVPSVYTPWSLRLLVFLADGIHILVFLPRQRDACCFLLGSYFVFILRYRLSLSKPYHKNKIKWKQGSPACRHSPLESLCFRAPVGPVEFIWLQLYQNNEKQWQMYK